MYSTMLTITAILLHGCGVHSDKRLASTSRLIEKSNNGEPERIPLPSKTLAQKPKPPPLPIQRETELSTSTQGREASSLGGAAIDIVRKVIDGDNSDG
ncbi:hypothetical protein MUBE_04175 [Mycobacterium uberis]|uniref:Uncharacterized protein n=1 Tax=Mycobacterium uberis TaxID=2162698 RepID=A0A3E1HJ11_9MYCO|nr:hypothetical protein [Mycobacterium uberis]RFD26448.1 hypothetical protein MUBE_04175 [Mycobacterium uberis]